MLGSFAYAQAVATVAGLSLLLVTLAFQRASDHPDMVGKYSREDILGMAEEN